MDESNKKIWKIWVPIGLAVVLVFCLKGRKPKQVFTPPQGYDRGSETVVYQPLPPKPPTPTPLAPPDTSIGVIRNRPPTHIEKVLKNAENANTPGTIGQKPGNPMAQGRGPRPRPPYPPGWENGPPPWARRNSQAPSQNQISKNSFGGGASLSVPIGGFGGAIGVQAGTATNRSNTPVQVVAELKPKSDLQQDLAGMDYEYSDNCFLLVSSAGKEEVRYYTDRCPSSQVEINSPSASWDLLDSTTIGWNGKPIGKFQRFDSGGFDLLDICTDEFASACSVEGDGHHLDFDLL